MFLTLFVSTSIIANIYLYLKYLEQKRKMLVYTNYIDETNQANVKLKDWITQYYDEHFHKIHETNREEMKQFCQQYPHLSFLQ